MLIRALILPLLLSFAPLGAAAQEALVTGQVQSPVLTIDVERLLAGTRFGQRLAEDLREHTEALTAENERLRLELTEEERSLTERRPSMEMEEFRAEADAFDRRVQGIRADQDAKQEALAARVEEGRQDFLNEITPVLGRLMIERGAAVIMERRDVFLSASVIDVTEEAIAAIDVQLGDGLTAPETPPREQDTTVQPEEAAPGASTPEGQSGSGSLDPNSAPRAAAEPEESD